MDAKVVDVPERGRFEVRVDDRVVGLASYHVDGTTMTLPHTEVDPSVGGRGIGTALVAGVLDAARERGLTVLPYCSFIRHYIQQHPEQWTSSRPTTGRTSAWRPPTADRRSPVGPAYAPQVPTSLLWFRRDLRLSDHPALLAALDAAGRRRRRRPGVRPRPAALDPGRRTPQAVPARLPVGPRRRDGRRAGPALRRPRDSSAGPRPRDREPAACTSRPTPGPTDDAGTTAVERALGDVPLIRTGSPYAVTPGRVTKADGSPFRVFTPFARAWRAHGWRAPRRAPTRFRGLTGVRVGRTCRAAQETAARLPAAGEAAALEAWAALPRRAAARLRRRAATSRDRRHEPALGPPQVRHRPPPDAAGRPGRRPVRGRRGPPVHRRAGLAGVLRRRAVAPARDGAARPSTSAWARMTYDSGPDADERFAAWAEGRTGLSRSWTPGMRQLRGEALGAQPGADDRRVVPRQGPAHRLVARGAPLPASTWSTATWPATTTAGSGSPAPAPTPRPTTGCSTRPRRASSSTRTATTSAAGCPSCATSPRGSCTSRGWRPAASPTGYPEPIVEHAHERQVALARYQEVRSGA